MGDSTFSGGWIFAFLIIAVIFGWGGAGVGGGNANVAAYATMADVNSALAAQTSAANQQAIMLSSANNNYETSRLISDQNMTMLQQQNSNLINAIQGFNQVSSNIAAGFSNVSSQIADLGYRMENCCCGIKTMMLENRLQDAQIALNNQNARIVAAEQSQYLLSQLGSFVPTTAAV